MHSPGCQIPCSILELKQTVLLIGMEIMLLDSILQQVLCGQSLSEADRIDSPAYGS